MAPHFSRKVRMKDKIEGTFPFPNAAKKEEPKILKPLKINDRAKIWNPASVMAISSGS